MRFNILNRSGIASLLLSLIIISAVTACGGGGGGGGGSSSTPTPAVLVSSVPSSGSTDVSIDSTVSVIFNKGIDETTIDGNYTLKDSDDNTVAGCSYCYTPDSKSITITPGSDLAYNKQYTLTLTTDIADIDGLNLTNPITVNFRTAEEPDTIDPEVDTGTASPAHNATNVALNTTIKIRFIENRDLDVSTLNSTNMPVKDESNITVPGTYSYNSSLKEVTFTPENSLDDNHTYSVTCTTNIKDTSGNSLVSQYSWSFKTAVVPPSVASTLPANAATNVAIDSAINIVFNKAMNAATINTTNITVNGGAGNIAGTVTYNSSNNTAVFTPSAVMNYSTDHTVTVSLNVEDTKGSKMTGNHSFTFRSAADTVAPVISSYTPVSNATNVSVDGTVTVTFSKSIDESTITAATFIVKDEFYNVIPGTRVYNDATKTVTYTPADPFIGKIKYNLQITTGVKGANGLNITSGAAWSITTGISTVDWVFMVYIAADNDLDLAAVADLEEMRVSNLNGRKVRFIVLCDRYGPNNTRLYEPMNNTLKPLTSTELGLVSTTAGELNTGDKTTLSNFISFVKNNYGAANYSLVLWNHGGGWKSSKKKKTFPYYSIPSYSFPVKPSDKEKIFKDICWDETSNSYLGNNDVQSVVSNKGINILAFDACLMGMIETAYEFRKSVTGIDYTVFSENVVPGSGYPYTAIINSFIAASDITPQNYSKIIVDEYIASYSGTNIVTMSAVNLNQIEDVVTKLNSFVTYLRTLPDMTQDIARGNAQAYAEGTYIDLWSYADGFADVTATDLKTSIENAVIENGYNAGVPGSKGLAIYAPTITKDVGYINTNNIYSIDFLTASIWDNYVQERNFGYTIDTVEPQTDAGGNIIDWVDIVKYTHMYGYTIDTYDADFYVANITAAGSFSVLLDNVPANCDLGILLYRIEGNGSLTYLTERDTGYSGQSESLFVSSLNPGAYLVIVVPVDNTSINFNQQYRLWFGGLATY